MRSYRQYRFSIHDIAQAAGISVWTARKDRLRGRFDPKDLLSLSQYLQKRGKAPLPPTESEAIRGQGVRKHGK